MAFLPALAVPILQALGLGGLSALGATAVKKVIGDAVPEEQIPNVLISSIQNQMDPTVAQSLGQSRLHELDQLKTAMGASPTLFLAQDALNPQSGTGLLNQPLVSSHSAQLNHSAQAQTLSDAAALSQLRGIQSQLLSIDPIQRARDPGVASLSQQDYNGNLWQQPGALAIQGGNVTPTSLPQNALQGLPPNGSSGSQGLAVQGTSHTPHQQQMMNSTLSIHPTSGLVIAPQPLNKLEGNQAVLVARPPILGTQNPVAQGIAGVGGGPGVANTVRGVGNGLFNVVKEAGSAAASNAIAQVGGTAGTVIKQGLSKAGGFLGNLISNGITGIAKKIIGDAPPTGFENFNGLRGGFIPPMEEILAPGKSGGLYTPDVLTKHVNTAKIVGDAPPGEQGEVMTDAQADAAVTNLKNSAKFNIESRIVLNEQILVASTSLPRGMSERQLNNFYARDLESLVGTYRQTEINAVFGMKGMCLEYDHFLTATYVPGANDTQSVYTGDNTLVLYATDYFYATGVALETARVAPPCKANTTLQQLSPLLAGAALGEYSSQLRIKTFSTDVDLMVRASAEALNNISSQQGYSFCLPLVKIMGYLLQHIQLFGSEINDLTSDLYYTPAQTHYEQHARSFPLETLEGEEIWGLNSWNGARFAVVSEADFIKATVGIIGTGNWGELAPMAWGLTCALVFIPNNDKDNQFLNAVRMVAQTAYPANMSYLPGNFRFFGPDGQLQVVKDKTNATKKTALTRIPGPYKNVLFVIMGARELQSAGVTIGDATGAENHSITLNGIDNPPSDPYVAGEGDTVMGYARAAACSQRAIPMMMAYIKEWEQTFGNSSDRSSAMRFWADNSMLFGNFFLARNAVDVGDVQAFAFHSWADPQPHGAISPMREFTDIPPGWEGNARVINAVNFNYLMNSMKTASYMPVARIAANDGNTSPWKWDSGSAPDGARLPFEDPMINFLVYKKWISPDEEYPEISLDDAARFGHTITVMANQLAGVCDLLVQERDFTLSEVVYPPLLLQRVPMAMMRQKNVLWPGFEEALMNGIQYPQFWNNRDVNMHCWNSLVYWEVCAKACYAEVVVEGSVAVSSARIPVSIMGQWFAPLYPQYVQLRLNLPYMKPQRNYVILKNVARAMFQAEYAEETTGLLGKSLAPISWLCWRLSLGVIISDRQSSNNAWLVQVANFRNIFEYLVHMEQPDASRNQVMAREYGAGNVTVPPTTKIALPVGEFIIKRSIATGLQPFSLLMQGPRDAFVGVGSGSTAYQMFIQTNTPQAIFVSETWATIPDWLFSPAGFQSMRDTI